jgi:hypothetical protein
MIKLGVALALVLAALAVGISGCGGDDSSNGGSGNAAVPTYKPSKVVARSNHQRTLLSSDPVEKVSSFYVATLDKDGWDTVSKSVSKYNANLTVKKSGTGASINISPVAGGSTTSISTYDSP